MKSGLRHAAIDRTLEDVAGFSPNRSSLGQQSLFRYLKITRESGINPFVPA